MKVLVTGGAGFIGSHLVDALVEHGYDVHVVDCLVQQVHGDRLPPRHLNARSQLIVGDIRNRGLMRQVLQDVKVVFHLAAEVGVGQSMYEVERYVGGNTYATSVLLDLLANEHHSVRKLIVASSMSIYGEGSYHCPEHGEVYPNLRSTEQLQAQDWEMRCPVPGCASHVEPIPTREDKPPLPTSIYAITKMDQEMMCMTLGRAYSIPTVAMRYFNAYGPRQALSNPYTGVVAIFCSRLLNGNRPLIFEDGRQSRDFVHVSDVVRANLLALERDEADFEVFNVGTGCATTILEVARVLAHEMGQDSIEPEIVGQFRAGDIRHCVADIAKAHEKLGYVPQISFKDGVAELIAWVKEQRAVDRVDRATDQLARRGLIQ